jgi:hypothetical protein
MATDKKQVFLESDDEIRGQKFVCLSFLTPEKALMRTKEAYMISRFLDFYALDYKVKATESFVLGQLRELQDVLSGVELDLANLPSAGSGATDDSSDNSVKELCAKVTKIREALARKSAEDLEAHVKTNLSDFKESTIQEAWDRYMLTNRTKLEDEFHKSNGFRTSVQGLKVRGVYATNEHATARAKSLHQKDPYHNVYVADVGEWLPWDPEPDDVSTQEYPNEQLNKLMQAYKENSAKKDAFFEEEKRQRMAEAASAASASKKAMFGQKGKEVEAGEVANDLFDGADADLAIARKAAATAAAAAADVNTISHA